MSKKAAPAVVKKVHAAVAKTVAAVTAPAPKAPKVEIERDRIDYSTLPHTADIVSAANLRNGMSPEEVHAALVRVLGDPNK